MCAANFPRAFQYQRILLKSDVPRATPHRSHDTATARLPPLSGCYTSLPAVVGDIGNIDTDLDFGHKTIIEKTADQKVGAVYGASSTFIDSTECIKL